DRRSGEHGTLAGAGQHARADRHDVRRLVARARTLDDRDFTGLGAALAGDHLELGIEVEQVAVRERDALHELGHEIGGIVDELLHGIVLSVEVEIRQWLWRLRQRSRCARRRSSCTSRGGWW